MSKKVYIITSGRYSDYGIDAVFEEKEKAESYSDAFSNTRVEEYEVGDVNQKLLRNNLYSVLLDSDGNEKYIRKQNRYGFAPQATQGTFIDGDLAAIGNKEKGDFSATVIAKDEQEALKIAGELKLQKSIDNDSN